MRGQGVAIYDGVLGEQSYLPYELALREYFDVNNWYQKSLHRSCQALVVMWHNPDTAWRIQTWFFSQTDCRAQCSSESDSSVGSLDLFGAQVPKGTYAALERNTSQVKDLKQVVPNLVVIVVHINGHPA